MKTHRLNVSYLVVGLVFLGISGIWALHETGVIALGGIQWLLPLTLVVAGAVGLVAFAARGIGARRTTTPATYDDHDDSYDFYPSEEDTRNE
ncbi:MAG: hypothetical protein ACXVW2_10045 [Nocardioidaceae bacterium]